MHKHAHSTSTLLSSVDLCSAQCPPHRVSLPTLHLHLTPLHLLSFPQTPLLSKLPSSLAGHSCLFSPVPRESPTTQDLIPQVLESALGILAHQDPLACQEHPTRSYSPCSEVRPTRDIHQKVWDGH